MRFVEVTSLLGELSGRAREMFGPPTRDQPPPKPSGATEVTEATMESLRLGLARACG